MTDPRSNEYAQRERRQRTRQPPSRECQPLGLPGIARAVDWALGDGAPPSIIATPVVAARGSTEPRFGTGPLRPAASWLR